MTEKELHRLSRQDLLQLLVVQSREVQDLQTKLQVWEEQCTGIQSVNDRLKLRLEEKDQIIERLKQRLDQKDARIAQLEGMLQVQITDRTSVPVPLTVGEILRSIQKTLEQDLSERRKEIQPDSGELL